LSANGSGGSDGSVGMLERAWQAVRRPFPPTDVLARTFKSRLMWVCLRAPLPPLGLLSVCWLFLSECLCVTVQTCGDSILFDGRTCGVLSMVVCSRV
jgi:hypothetical protein